MNLIFNYTNNKNKIKKPKFIFNIHGFMMKIGFCAKLNEIRNCLFSTEYLIIFQFTSLVLEFIYLYEMYYLPRHEG